MGVGNTRDAWGWPARLIHWIMALLVIGMLAFGFYLTNGFNPGDPAKLGLVQQHKSFGFTVFALACLRLVWRAMNPTPKLPDGMNRLERTAARASHIALYMLMVALPISGWLMASASPFNNPDAYPFQIKNMVFGLFELPDPIEAGTSELERLFRSIHFYCALTLLAVLVAHVTGALKHHFIKQDNVLTRMFSGR